jgi:hypothetical protein
MESGALKPFYVFSGIFEWSTESSCRRAQQSVVLFELAVVWERPVVAAESAIEGLKLEPSTRLEMSVVEVVTLENPDYLWRNLLEALVNQARPVSDAEQQISGEDVIERFLFPCPWLLNIVNLEVTVR